MSTPIHTMPVDAVVNRVPINYYNHSNYRIPSTPSYQSWIESIHEADGMKNDYEDEGYCMTTLPQPTTEEVRYDGYAECICTGWFKRKILSIPRFPLPISRPPHITYKVRETPIGGLGVLATEDIKAGDLIIAERPLLVEMSWTVGVPQVADPSQEQISKGMYADMETVMEAVCTRMSTENLKAYESLYNNHLTDGSGPLTCIRRTNGFGDPMAVKVTGPNGARYSVMGALSSRINHDCSPNAVHAFNITAFCMENHAVRAIAKGEEITVSYAPLEHLAERRQNMLKRYGFTCVCRACMNPMKSDPERSMTLYPLLPKSSQGVKHADTVLAAYDATGLQCHLRYIELLRRVAKIHRKQGSKERANTLEILTNAVSTALHSRDPLEM